MLRVSQIHLREIEVKLNREINEIRRFCKINREKLIYISTYSIIDRSRLKKQYVKNKVKIEKIIRKKLKDI